MPAENVEKDMRRTRSRTGRRCGRRRSSLPPTAATCSALADVLLLYALGRHARLGQEGRGAICTHNFGIGFSGTSTYPLAMRWSKYVRCNTCFYPPLGCFSHGCVSSPRKIRASALSIPSTKSSSKIDPILCRMMPRTLFGLLFCVLFSGPPCISAFVYTYKAGNLPTL